MDSALRTHIAQFYDEGFTMRQISDLLGGQYHREAIRNALHKEGAALRGIGVKYKLSSSMNDEEKALFAEFLGYMYGDGYISKHKTPTGVIIECRITLALNEEDVVQRVEMITQKLFSYKVAVKYSEHCATLDFRRSVGRYLFRFGYPCGKKSSLNPPLPLEFLCSKEMKAAFLRGFFNAECSVNKTVFVHQSVRTFLSETQVKQLKECGTHRSMKGRECCFIAWSKAKAIVGDPPVACNILLGVQKILYDLEIPTRLYPIRVYMGHKGVSSIHYELWIRREHIKRVLELRLVSCTKKVAKLHSILRE
jgi:hypothetical protein